MGLENYNLDIISSSYLQNPIAKCQCDHYEVTLMGLS